jgi:type IV pilus assembly protein PilC
VVSIVCLAVLVGLVVFVVPVFAKVYEQLHVVLPGPTQALVVVGDLIRNRWWALGAVVLVAAILLRRARKSDYVRAKWDVFRLNMPVFGKVNRMVIISHFTRTFAMLASVGVSIIDALETASQGSSLKNYDLFPPMIVQLAVSGEQAGILPDMLNKGADFLDKDIDRVTQALLIKLEPILTVVMGIVVGLILMAVYLPMFDYMAHLE